MATFLYRLGRFAFVRRRAVLVAWVALLVLLGGAAAAFSERPSEEFKVPGTEAQTTLDRIKGAFPEQANASGQLVFTVDKGRRLTDAAPRAAVLAAVERVADVPAVASAAEPFGARAVSPDGRVAIAQLGFDEKVSDVTDADRSAVREAVGDAAADAGVTVKYGGDAFVPPVTAGSSEVIGLGVAVVVLLVTFGSVVAAGLPLLTALIGVGVGLAGVFALSGSFELISTAPVLALMIGLAVGIDYALFIVSRHRQHLAEGMVPQEAAARATGTAGSAVVFAGLTVVAALAGLSVVGIPFLTVMGLSSAAAVLVAVLVAVTLVPALLGFAGTRIAGRRRTRTGTSTGTGPEADRPPRETFGTRWARLVTRRPVAVLLLGLLGLGALAVPAADLRLGLTSPGSQAEHTSARQAYDLVSERFGPGFNGPLTVVVDASGAPKPKQAVARVTAEVGRMPGVAATLPPAYDARSGTAVVTALPKTGPDSARTKQLVSDLRDHRADWKETTGADVAVTGTTAAAIDVSQKLTDALPPFLAVIVGIAAVLLTLAFRSVLIPLKAIAGFLLSIAASTGVVVAVYQWGWLADFVGVPRTGPVVSFLPILLISVLFGLAMDYQLFLVSRMKEEYVHGAAPRDAVVRGFGHSARVVTAAALIMVSVFAGFVFDDDPIIQPIGFALAVGVLVDAFVVRMALVPAAMALAGRAAWWFPRSWERVVPRVDMEGEALATEPPVREPVGAGPRVKV